MALNYVTLTVDMYDGSGNAITSGAVYFTPNEVLMDSTDHEFIVQNPIAVLLAPSGLPTVSLVATDNSNITPSGWKWVASFQVPGLSAAALTFSLAHANGASQYFSAVA